MLSAFISIQVHDARQYRVVSTVFLVSTINPSIFYVLKYFYTRGYLGDTEKKAEWLLNYLEEREAAQHA